MALLEFNFESKYLGSNHTIGVILPDRPRDIDPEEFYASGEKYKVLWLLHGTFGDYSDWIRKSMIELYATEKNLIVVMPSGLNANYENWPEFGIGYNFYDYFFKELMPLIYNWFPASDKREDNFIAGLSMGGGGVCKYVCAHPEKFAAACILSSAPRNYKQMFRHYDEVNERTKRDVNRWGGKKQYLDSMANTWQRFEELAPTGKLPRLFFCVGEDDFLYDSFVAFRKHAKKIGLEAKFETEPGYTHEWRFWDLFIQKALEFFELPETHHDSF